MSYQFYKILHFIGIFMVFSGLGGQLLQAINKGPKQHPGKKWLAIWHGVGLVALLVAGFGLLARQKYGFVDWVIVKLGIWFVLGGIGAIAMRKQELGKLLWVVTIALGGVAAFLAVYRPTLF
jgi:hypothetical protein